MANQTRSRGKHPPNRERVLQTAVALADVIGTASVPTATGEQLGQMNRGFQLPGPACGLEAA